jgi:IS30 family transposase
MAGKYLTWEQRIQIEAYFKIKKKPCEIARLMGLHHSTIYRELKRGMYEHDIRTGPIVWRYSAEKAQQKHNYAQTNKGRPDKLGNDHDLAAFLERKIVEDRFSPAAALGEIKRKGLTFSTSFCVTTLYSYIDKGYFLRLTNKNLLVKSRRKKNTYKPVRRIYNALAPSIEQRPEDVDNRDSFGNWEMDTVVSKQGKRTVLLVLTERMTRKELIFKLPDRKAETIVAAIDKLERKTPRFKQIFQSITVDNGGEFADWNSLQRSIRGGQRTKVYFCHPYSSWERGSNENCNSIIRRFIPKGADISDYTDRQIKEVETWINNYPRKIHNFLAADDLYKACIGL